MLLICFTLGDERFAMDTSQVQELIPVVRMKTIPGAPEWVAGVMRYQGKTVPVVDLCALHLEKTAAKKLSTRIIVARFMSHHQEEHLLGLLAEQVTETIYRQPEDFVSTGVDTPEFPHLGGVADDQEGMLQWVEIDKLLPEHVQNLLYQDDPAQDQQVSKS